MPACDNARVTLMTVCASRHHCALAWQNVRGHVWSWPPPCHSTDVMSTGNWALTCPRSETSERLLRCVLAVLTESKEANGFKTVFRQHTKRPTSPAALVHCSGNCVAFLSVAACLRSVAMSGKGAKGLSGSGKGAKGTMGDKKGDKKKPVSRSARAGLQFPVGRIHRLLKVSELSFLEKLKQRLLPVLLRVQIFSYSKRPVALYAKINCWSWLLGACHCQR